jgi:putative copper export protein
VSDEGRFTEEDLAPSVDDRAAVRAAVVDRVATSVAVLAAGFWVGGLIALGACAAPFVFRLTPAPFSGDAMGAAFRRFDSFAMGASVAICGAEVVRTFLARRRRRAVVERLRGALAIALAAAAAYVGLALTPRILELHQAGARRGDGGQGVELDSVHRRAEAVGKAEVGLAVVLVGLHVFTLRARRPEDDEDDLGAAAPLPPGPRA